MPQTSFLPAKTWKIQTNWHLAHSKISSAAACLTMGCGTVASLYPWADTPSSPLSLICIMQRNSTCKGSLMIWWSLFGSLHAQRHCSQTATGRFKPWPVPMVVKHQSSIFLPVSLSQDAAASRTHPDPKPSLQTFTHLLSLRGKYTGTPKNQSSQLKYWQSFSPWSSLKEAAVIFIKLLIMDCGTKQFIKFPL